MPLLLFPSPLPPLQTSDSTSKTRVLTLLGESVWKLKLHSCDDRMGLVLPAEMMYLWTTEEHLEWDRIRRAWWGDIVLSGGSRQNASKIYCAWHTSVETVSVLYDKRLLRGLAVVFHTWNTLGIIFIPFLKVSESICGSSDVLEKGYLEHCN